MRALIVPSVACALVLGGSARAEEYSAQTCDRYQTEYDANPTGDNIGKLMSAAFCREKIDRLADALTAWRRVERESTSPDTKTTAHDNVTRLEALVATVEVDVRPGFPPVNATLDGAPVSLGAKVPVNAGSHTIATSDGKSTTTQASNGQRVTIQVPLDTGTIGVGGTGGTGGAGGGPAEGTSPANPGLLTGGVVSVIVGGVGLAAFAITGAISLSKDAELTDLCGEDRDHCPPAERANAEDIASTGRTVNVVNVVTLVVGIVGIGVGVPMIIVGTRRGSRATPSAVRVGPPVPWATDDAAGLVWGGAF